MSQNIDNAFISQFEEEVKLAYQRMGSKLTNTVRKKSNVKGKDTTFQKVGTGTAGQKSRHGLVPLMNLDHQPVKCTLADYYAGDYIDSLDELKTNIDERNVVAQSGAAAMGRKSDEILNTVLAAATTVNAAVAAGGTGLTQTKVNGVFEGMGIDDIPDDGERYAVVSPQVWTDLLGITAFSSSDYVGSDEIPYKGGMVAKRWMSFMWFTFSGLSNGAGGAGEVRNLFYHKTAAGFASGKEISSTTSFENDRQAFLTVYSMSQGAVEIDGKGIRVVDAVR